MQFSITVSKRGRGIWKFDKTPLESKDFKNYIIKTIQTSASDNKQAEHTLLWETIKSSVRGACVSFASKVRWEARCEIESIENKIKEVKKSLHSGFNKNATSKESRLDLETNF